MTVPPSLWLDTFRHPELGNSSYLVGAGRDAVVIDPVRDVGRYLNRARERGARIRWVFETHLHNDFISGGRELARRADATLAAPRGSKLRGEHRALGDGERLDVGSARLVSRASPGHTPEHMSYLLIDENERPRRLFSGGSLMVGSAARPDLLGPRHTLPLVRAEWNTLQGYLADLPGSVAVHPTHSGGSFCGAGASHRAASTIHQERRTNRLVRSRSFLEFVERYLTSDPFPSYYRGMRLRNRRGSPEFGVKVSPPARLSPEELTRIAGKLDVVVVDVRSQVEFDAGHIPNSIYIGHEGAYTAWLGWSCSASERFVIVGRDERSQEEAALALRRIGFDRIEGQLAGGFPAYALSKAPIRSTPRGSIQTVRRALSSGEPMTILDVRQPSEYAERHLPGARSIPLGEIRSAVLKGIPRDLPIYVHCAFGERSAVAASRLERMGFLRVVHVTNGPTEG